MSVPNLTHIQAKVLSIIGAGSESGREIRERLGSERGPAFYQMMARMEESGLVLGEYRQKTVESQMIRERIYSATEEGKSKLAEVIKFYENAT